MPRDRYCDICGAPLDYDWVDDGADEETGKQTGHYEYSECPCESESESEEEEEEEA
jgi:hypothetical protein